MPGGGGSTWGSKDGKEGLIKEGCLEKVTLGSGACGHRKEGWPGRKLGPREWGCWL